MGPTLFTRFSLKRPTTNTALSIEWLCLQEACHDKGAARLYWDLGFLHSLRVTIVLSQLHRVSTMDTNPQRQKEHDGSISLLNAAIEALNLAKDLSSITPAKVVFASASTLLTMIRVCVSLFSDGLFQVHVQSGLHGQQNRLRRAGAGLRGCMRSP